MKRGSGVKLGVIGAGSMGKNHARIAAALPGVKLAGVADIDPAAAESVGREIGVPYFTDFRQLLPLIDAACLVTPTRTHFDLAQELLTAGKHLLIEKPFTGSLSPARQLAALANEKGVVLAVGLIERFNPAFQKIVREVRGEKIIGIDIKRLSPFPERIADTDVVFDMMFHDLDLLLCLMPDEIIDLRAKGEKIRTKTYDRVVATFTHKNGTICRLEASRIFGSKSRKLSITTDKSLIEADLLNRTIYVRDFSTPTPSTLPVRSVDQLTEELRDFVLSVKGKRRPLVSGDDCLKVLSLAEEVEKACS